MPIRRFREPCAYAPVTLHFRRLCQRRDCFSVARTVNVDTFRRPVLIGETSTSGCIRPQAAVHLLFVRFLHLQKHVRRPRQEGARRPQALAARCRFPSRFLAYRGLDCDPGGHVHGVGAPTIPPHHAAPFASLCFHRVRHLLQEPGDPGGVLGTTWRPPRPGRSGAAPARRWPREKALEMAHVRHGGAHLGAGAGLPPRWPAVVTLQHHREEVLRRRLRRDGVEARLRDVEREASPGRRRSPRMRPGRSWQGTAGGNGVESCSRSGIGDLLCWA